METILGRPIPNYFDLNFAENISPDAGARLWLPIVEMMLSLSSQLENAFSRNRISNESVSKAVPYSKRQLPPAMFLKPRPRCRRGIRRRREWRDPHRLDFACAQILRVADRHTACDHLLPIVGVKLRA